VRGVEFGGGGKRRRARASKRQGEEERSHVNLFCGAHLSQTNSLTETTSLKIALKRTLSGSLGESLALGILADALQSILAKQFGLGA
jgi:hypothetical protein